MDQNKPEENNPETGTNNVFRKEGDTQRPAEAGNKGSELTPTSDKGDLGKQTNMERTSYQQEEGYFTMDDDESGEGLGGELPGYEPGAG